MVGDAAPAIAVRDAAMASATTLMAAPRLPPGTSPSSRCSHELKPARTAVPWPFPGGVRTPVSHVAQALANLHLQLFVTLAAPG